MKTPSLQVKDRAGKIIDEALFLLQIEGWITSDDHAEVFVILQQRIYGHEKKEVFMSKTMDAIKNELKDIEDLEDKIRMGGEKSG